MDSKKDKVKIQDVANAAGVSIATVSRAINKKDNVKESTYYKIMDAISDVGYDNFIIRNNTKLILILLTTMENFFCAEIVKGISCTARRHDYREIIVCTNNDTLTQNYVENIIHNTRVEGIIALDVALSGEILDKLRKKIPIVQCIENSDSKDVSYVSIDNVSTIKSVVEYILSKGKKRIAFLNGPLIYNYLRKRREGYLQALKLANIEVKPGFIVELPDFRYDIAISVATQLLSSSEPPDAVIASSDIFALATLKVAKQLDLKIPQELGVVGLDNSYLSIVSEPTITSVKQPQFQLGFLSCEILIEEIKYDKETNKNILLKTELIVRETL